MPSAEITLERSIFIGLIFTSILYGVYLTLYYHSFRLLWKRPRSENKMFYTVYSSFLLLFLTISIATNCAFADLMWIDDRDIPGGPPAYYANNVSAWYNTFGTAADMAAYAMADGLLLYRCFVFWRDRPWLVAFPALIYVASIAMAIMMTLESAVPGANIFQGLPTSFGIPWMALTVSLNIIVTLMIIGRLLVMYWHVRQSLNSNFSATYIDASAMLAESALPFSVLGVGYLVCVVTNSNVAIAFAFIWGTYAALAPQFIIYRVALGVAWSKDTTFATTGSMDFMSNPGGEFSADKSAGLSSGVGGSTFSPSMYALASV